MTTLEKERLTSIITRAYEQMMKEVSGRPCISRRARSGLFLDLHQASLIDRRTTICRFCLLVAERMDTEERFDLTRDLEWLDATRDLLEYGEPMNWKITQSHVLEFS